MSKPPEGSRGWWKKNARTKQFVINHMARRMKELEADYDLVEAELRQRIETCTCQKDVT